MSVIRKIKANKPVQANSDSIGVLVKPSAEEIKFSINLISLTVASEPFGNPIITDHEDVIYEKDDTEVKVIEGTTYYGYAKSGSEETEYKFLSIEEPAEGNTIYTITGEEVVPYSTVKSVFSIDGTATQVDKYKAEYGDYTYNIVPAFGTYDAIKKQDVDGGQIVGLITASTSTENEVEAEKQSESSFAGKTEWSDGTNSYWTDSDDPVEDDAVYPSKENPDWDNGKVISTTPESISCTVEYSVDGAVWTTHETTLTESNNVICNIPNWMYLRFSQNVEITER